MTRPLSILLLGFASAALGQNPHDKAGAADAVSFLAADDDGIAEADLRSLLETLTSEAYEGRGTGLPGCRKATALAAAVFEDAGLVPAGDDDTWFQAFPFRSGFKLGDNNHAVIDWGGGVLQNLVNRSTYTPLVFSPASELPATEIVFVGFGIQTDGYDSYEGLEVKDKWVMTFRGAPKIEDRDLEKFGPLVAKAATAKEQGAAGLIFVKGANKEIPNELMPLRSVGERGPILPAVTVRNALADQLLGDRRIDELHRAYASGAQTAGFALTPKLEAAFDIEVEKSSGRNVLGILPAGDTPRGPAVVLCAHIDHLGFGDRGGSRAKGRQRDALHPGADDNASGTAALLEIAQHLAARRKAGQLTLERDLLFIAFSGEEIGLVGSSHFVNELKKAGALSNRVAACVNLDMLGRLREDKVTVLGVGTCSEWPGMVQSVGSNLNLLVQGRERQAASDSAPFDRAGIPSVFVNSGMHPDYHTPRDTAETINFAGLARMARFAEALVLEAAGRGDRLVYQRPKPGPTPPKVLIGMVPEEAEGGVRALSLTDGLPAAKSGMLPGDVLIRLAGKPVEDIEGLFGILRGMKPNKPVEAVVRRGESSERLTITPVPR